MYPTLITWGGEMLRINMFQTALLVLLCLGLTALISADVPNTINYQGRLTDDAGQPVNGSKLVKFKIYGSESGSDSLWSSGYQVISINDGLFKYELGSNPPLPDDLFTGDDPRYLGITVDVDAELEPRTQFIAVPYAIRAQLADSLNNAPYVRKAGDTISGSMIFDNNGAGKEVELLLYTGGSILNFYESGTKRITLESEFGTVVLRGEDGSLSLWLSGGEGSDEGGSIRLYNSEGASQLYLDGDKTGDGSAMFTDGAINSDEMLNEPGLVYNSISNTIEVTSSTMTDLVTVSITIPEPGYIHVTGKAVIQRSVGSPAEACYCGSYMQIDATAGGSFLLPYFSYIYSWVENYDMETPFVERTYYMASAGTYTFRLEASKYVPDGDCTVVSYARVITAVYYPTSYETPK